MRDAIRYTLFFMLAAGGLVFILFLPTIIAGMRGHPRLREVRQLNLSDMNFGGWLSALFLAFTSRRGVAVTPVQRGWRSSATPPPDLSPPVPDTPAVVIQGTVCRRCGTRAEPFGQACLRCGAALNQARR